MVDESKGAEAGAGGVIPVAEAASVPPVPSLAAKADDLEAIRDAVVDAAGVSAGLWLSYLFVVFYLLVAAGGVTHRDLFFESPVKLPFLNVDLPLKGFFWLGPGLFLILHTYLLLHFVLLASKVRVFDNELRKQIADGDVRTRLRRQLPSNIFIQFLAGPREVRDGITGLLLELIAWISLVIGPVALLVFFELQFLPYHDPFITWWQRITVLIDLALLWMLWPAVVRRESTGSAWRGMSWTAVSMLACISLVAIPMVLAIATFRGEWLDKELRKFSTIPFRQALVEGEIDFGARTIKSPWSNRLVLPGLDVIDHIKLDTEAKIAAVPEVASLRARHLESVVLIEAKLRKVDFTAAHLEGAILDRADLRDAKFACAPLPPNVLHLPPGPDLAHCTQLQGASLANTRLPGAALDYASLQGASLKDA